MSKKIRVGDIRPSQAIFSHGVGSLVDLPHLSVLVMGLDDWDVFSAPRINEDRLLNAVKAILGTQVQELVVPPPIPPETRFNDGSIPNGIPVAAFPRWMLCPHCSRLATIASGLFTFNGSNYGPEHISYVHRNCDGTKYKNPKVVPARFLVACENGHLDDFPWDEFVHRGPNTCNPLLRLSEYGPSGEARDLMVKCETCGKQRNLSEAFGEEGRSQMPQCRGRRPHLRDFDQRGCNKQVRTILLGASNLWFSDYLSALSIPDNSAKLSQYIKENWSIFEAIEKIEDLPIARRFNTKIFEQIREYSDNEIVQTINENRNRRDNAQPEDPSDLRPREWLQFINPLNAPSDKDFKLSPEAVPKLWSDQIERVVLAERLREVQALIGFTRIDSPGEFGQTLEAGAAQRMSLSHKPSAWVPAAEVRGEGIFIQFKESAIQAWLQKDSTQRREQQFLEAHRAWRSARGIMPADDDFPGMRYVLIHTFAHALMRQFVLECGYSAASLRERIYARDADPLTGHEAMAGVLIYTAASDSEGTLGGLIELGSSKELGRHISSALYSAKQCGSDPLCAEHLPSQRGTTVHAAACHACLFAPETSCERGNRYLDRSVLAETVDSGDYIFISLGRN